MFSEWKIAHWHRALVWGMERSHRCGTFITCITLSVVEKSHRWCCGVFIFLFDLFAADDLVDIMKCKYSKYFIKKLLIYGFVFHWFTWNILLISSYTVWTAINCSQWVLLLLFVVHPLILSSTQFLQDWTGLSPYHFVFSFLFKINSSVCGNEELTGGGLVCGKALVFINIVALRWAQLILGWVSVCGM